MGKTRVGVLKSLFLLPPAILLAAFLCFSVDVPYLDQWEFVPFLQKALNGALTAQDFWAQHNEHRILFPRIIMLALARATHWDVRAELALNFFLGVALFLLFAWQVRLAACEAGKPAPWGALSLVSLLTFSLSQWQNWFLGWQLQELLSLLCVVGSFFLLANPTRGAWALMGAVAAGIVGTFSFANGMLVWPAGALTLVVAAGWQPATRRSLAVWLIAGMLTAFAYLHGYQTPSYHPPVSAVLNHAPEYPVYVLRYLGQPVINWNGTAAACAGTVGLLAWLAMLPRARKGLLAVALALGLYAVGSALLTGLARVGFGTDQAMSSRYITLANPLWLANVLLACTFLTPLTGHARTRAIRIAGWTFALLLVTSSLYGGYRWTERCHAYRQARPALLSGEEPELLRRLYPDVSVLLERREFLKKHRLSVFR